MNDEERWEREGAPLFRDERAGAREPHPAELARVKAGVKQRLEQQRRWSRAPRLAIVAAVAVLAVVAVMLKRGSDESRIDVIEGTVASAAGLFTTGEAPAELALGSVARVKLSAQTAARVRSVSEVELVNGRLRAKVAHGPFRVRAAAVTLEVVGTVFEVACAGGEVQLMVSEGVVRATRGTQSWDVKAGETWPPAPAPVPVEAVAPPAPPSPVKQSRLAEAELLTQQGKLDAARAIYAELSKEEAPIGELALYHLAHLEAVRAKRPAVALEALEEQLRRFPDGALAHEAKLSRIEALRALGRSEDLPLPRRGEGRGEGRERDVEH